MIEQTHTLLPGIASEDVDGILGQMKLIQQRTQASIDQLLAELEGSWANVYTTQYIKTAGAATALTLMDDPEEPEPVPIHLVECPTPRHRLPPGVPKILVDAWRPYLDENEDEDGMGLMALVGGSAKAWTIRKVPLYTPTNAFHESLNNALIMGEERFREATLELDRVFEKRDSLARQYNAALFGSLAITAEDDDDGSSQVTG